MNSKWNLLKTLFLIVLCTGNTSVRADDIEIFQVTKADECSRYFSATDITSFTSPVVGVDMLSRTKSFNDIFFPMFNPDTNVNWNGNIKKLNLVMENNNAVLKDDNNEKALESCPDNQPGEDSQCIKSTATTAWNNTGKADGNRVNEGGVGALLIARDPADRSLYSNTGTSDVLEVFSDISMNYEAFDFQSDAALFNFFNVENQEALSRLLLWARGFDVNDENNDGSSADPQPWILADMLHSRPVVIHYGVSNNGSVAGLDQRLIVGTNAGFVHMFDAENGNESWAFFPKELAPILKQRMDNPVSSEHLYGIDATAAIYIEDGGDGTVHYDQGDTVYAYFSLRRGGRDIYALDISYPDTPSFLWKIKGGEGVFSELGETWSVPLVSVIPGYSYDHDADAGTPMMPKKVLIFGAGYDNNKDTAGVGTADSMGRGIFIVDATTGKLVRSITPDKETQQNIQVEGLIHSVPSQLNALDSNGDGITDRLYFGDTGGNLWRVDMPGNALHGATTADGTTASWQVTLLASINGGTTSTDRRFFNTPDVVRSKSKVCKEYQRTATDEFCISAASIKYDAILIGTGDRTNPTATDVNNHFYMFRDMQLSPYSNESPDAQACSAAKSAIPPGVVDFRCYLPLGIEQLYNATSNIIQTGTKGQIDVASKVLDNSKGWFIDLSAEGEKSLSRAITLDGSVFFTSYSYSKADRTNSETCGAVSGMSRLYQIDLQNASARGDFEDEDPSERSTFLGAMIAEIPSLHFGMDNKIRLLSTSGNSIKVFESGAKIPQPYGIYWYRGE